MKKLILFSIVCLAAVACGKKAVSNGATAPTPAVAATPEESVWRTQCSKCHGITGKKGPKSHTAAEWVDIVNRMQAKKGGNQFSDEQKAQIMKYLSANAK
jgi:cytochrome c5